MTARSRARLDRIESALPALKPDARKAWMASLSDDVLDRLIELTERKLAGLPLTDDDRAFLAAHTGPDVPDPRIDAMSDEELEAEIERLTKITDVDLSTILGDE